MLQLSLLCAALLLSFIQASPISDISRRSSANKVLIDANFADPTIIQDGKTWYAFSTDNKGLNVPWAS
jgi:hypothetical protein